MNERIISTDTVKRGPVIDSRPTPPSVGPSTNDGRGGYLSTPKEFCIRYALPDEWAAFQRTVAARVAKEPKTVWEKCRKCGFVVDRPYRHGTDLSEPGGPCIRCNWQRLTDGGFMRDMAPAEVEAHLTAQAKARAAEIERDRRAAFYSRNDERQRAGLPPFKTIADWQKDEAARRVRLTARKK